MHTHRCLPAYILANAPAASEKTVQIDDSIAKVETKTLVIAEPNGLSFGTVLVYSITGTRSVVLKRSTISRHWLSSLAFVVEARDVFAMEMVFGMENWGGNDTGKMLLLNISGEA